MVSSYSSTETRWGVSETLTFVVKADKSLDGYLAFGQAFGRELREKKMPSYFAKTNTTTVTEIA